MTEYTVISLDETNTLSVTTEAENAEVLIEYNGQDSTNKTVNIEWWAEENPVSIYVSNGDNEIHYSVVVIQRS